MEKDAAALLLLLFVLVLAMLGIALWVSGSSRRAHLTERGRGGEDEAAVTRLRHSVDARLRRSKQGRRLATWLQSAGSPVAARRLRAAVLQRDDRGLGGLQPVRAARRSRWSSRSG